MTGVNQGSHYVVVVELGGGNVVVCISSGQGGSVPQKGFKPFSIENINAYLKLS